MRCQERLVSGLPCRSRSGGPSPPRRPTIATSGSEVWMRNGVKSLMGSRRHALAAGVKLHYAIEVLMSLVERAHADALVQSVDAAAVRVAEHAVQAVGRDAGVVGEAPVGRSGAHRRHERHAGPQLGADL